MFPLEFDNIKRSEMKNSKNFYLIIIMNFKQKYQEKCTYFVVRLIITLEKKFKLFLSIKSNEII